MKFELSHLKPEMPVDKLYQDLSPAQREMAIKLDAIIWEALAGTNVVHVPDELVPGIMRDVVYRVAARISAAIRLKCKFVPDQS